MIENGQPSGGYILSIGGKRIPFRIEFRSRKKLAITVHPDLRLEVVAPESAASDDVLARVARRGPWILKQCRHFERYLPRIPSLRFVSGETLLYLGRQYRLKIREGAPDRVALLGRYLQVWTENPADAVKVRGHIDTWYREHAEAVFRKRLQVCLESRPSLTPHEEVELRVRRMIRRWGSCTKAGHILLNFDLVKVPIHCIDYVLVHELCHLQIHNHSEAFYRLLGRHMPDWERRKRRLDEFVS
jgi:predicted metal-dependent hydrolase